MATLVVEARGATERLLVQPLLNRKHNVTVIVRSPENLPEALKQHDNLSVIRASLMGRSGIELAQHRNGCNAVASPASRPRR